MSRTNVEAFYKRLANDAVFRAQVQSAKSKDECSQIVKGHGYDFTEEEYQDYTIQLLDSNDASKRELLTDLDKRELLIDLDEKELAEVIGGVQAQPAYGVIRPYPTPIPIEPYPKPIAPFPYPIAQPVYGVVRQDSVD